MRRSLGVGLIAAVVLVAGGCVQEDGELAAVAEPVQAQITVEEAAEIFDYAYPLVIMKISQDLMFTVPFRPPSHPNQFIHFKRLAMPQNRAVVLGNRNTLYSVGWIDLSAGPVLFEIPDMGDRYFVMPLLDAWTNTFKSLGSRTTGQSAQKYMIANSVWQESPPEGYELIFSPTNMVWITGRIQADNPQDASAAGLLQDAYRLLTLQEAESGDDPFTEYEPTFKATEVGKPVPYSLKMPASEFYDTFFQSWRDNAPLDSDEPFLEVLSRAGIQPSDNLSFTQLPETSQVQLTAGLELKQATYQAAFYAGEKQQTPWIFNRERMGIWGTDYARRAYWAMWGLGANLVEDAVYGVSQLDQALDPLAGESTYRLHFAAEEVPPTNAFWSVTA